MVTTSIHISTCRKLLQLDMFSCPKLFVRMVYSYFKTEYIQQYFVGFSQATTVYQVIKGIASFMLHFFKPFAPFTDAQRSQISVSLSRPSIAIALSLCLVLQCVAGDANIFSFKVTVAVILTKQFNCASRFTLLANLV